jgi:hypothetical protein
MEAIRHLLGTDAEGELLRGQGAAWADSRRRANRPALPNVGGLERPFARDLRNSIRRKSFTDS